VIVLLYVDDALIASRTREAVEHVKQALGKFFKLQDLKEAHSLLSFSIERDREQGTLKVHQEGYVEDLLVKFRMEDCAPCSVPIAPGAVITKHGEALGSEVPYGSLIGRWRRARFPT
jgi:hypothetical protein